VLMAPIHGHDVPEDTYDCGICADLILDPVTLPCCGNSFCRKCLQTCITTSAKSIGSMPRCPSGCGEKLPVRLPATSRILQRAVEAMRIREAQGHVQDIEEQQHTELGNDPSVTMPRGIVSWQEVAAAHDLMIGDLLVANHGAKAVVISGDIVPDRVTVRFDNPMDGVDRFIHVAHHEIVPQLPKKAGVCIGQRVVATGDLHVGDLCIVRLGMQGTVLRQSPCIEELRVTVQFDEREDGDTATVEVMPHEITPLQVMPGGFLPGHRVRASRDLKADERLLVKAGVDGVIIAPYSDSRLTVRFSSMEGHNGPLVNVKADEILRAMD